jgi:hypothetical protein
VVSLPILRFDETHLYFDNRGTTGSVSFEEITYVEQKFFKQWDFFTSTGEEKSIFSLLYSFEDIQCLVQKIPKNQLKKVESKIGIPAQIVVSVSPFLFILFAGSFGDYYEYILPIVLLPFLGIYHFTKQKIFFTDEYFFFKSLDEKSQCYSYGEVVELHQKKLGEIEIVLPNNRFSYYAWAYDEDEIKAFEAYLAGHESAKTVMMENQSEVSIDENEYIEKKSLGVRFGLKSYAITSVLFTLFMYLAYLSEYVDNVDLVPIAIGTLLFLGVLGGMFIFASERIYFDSEKFFIKNQVGFVREYHFKAVLSFEKSMLGNSVITFKEGTFIKLDTFLYDKTLLDEFEKLLSTH